MNKYEIMVRLALAVFIGGVIGYEREHQNRPAGFRTHTLVCIGATVISMIQQSTIAEVSMLIKDSSVLSGGLKSDIGRMGAQVISGVGFLGAGTIIRDKGSVKGLTTAASLWAVACIGLAVGLGYYFLSIASALVVFVALVTFKRIDRRIIQKSNIVDINIVFTNRKKLIQHLEEYFSSNDIKVRKIEYVTKEEGEANSTIYTIIIPRTNSRTTAISKILQEINIFDEVVGISLE